ncbi:hypothetical protein O1R50_25145 [Glycomyces luteolus]|uniref:DivIVA domain-containing protein n=1 Tax=Glycomyces luteolus TaxID=2670330 RepID=A0A9X3PGB2_9ACTN|nr:hypothetical protein [Glycomyces luteolus]MDA1362925.1 hypothetical protein [Glycomyces luteolus]
MSKFFEETGPEFAVSMRGYDRQQVDEFTTRLYQNIKDQEQYRDDAQSALEATEQQLRRAEERIMDLERRVAEQAALFAEVEVPTLSGLGARVEKVLRAAEQDAAVEREDAKRQAVSMLNEARAEAEVRIRNARSEASEMTASAERDVTEIRARAVNETTEMRENARRNHELAVADVRREAQTAQSQTRSEAEKLRSQAEREIAVRRATAEREVAELRAIAVREADEQRSAASSLVAETAEHRKKRTEEHAMAEAERRERAQKIEADRLQQALATAQRIVAEAEERLVLAEERARSAENRTLERREEVDLQAKGTLDRAVEQARAIKAESEKEAARVRSSAEERAAEYVHPLVEEVEALMRQRDIASSNLTDLGRHLGLVSEEEEPTTAPAANSDFGSSFVNDGLDVLSMSSGFDLPVSLELFDLDTAPLLVKQRVSADVDRTQQLPVVR